MSVRDSQTVHLSDFGTGVLTGLVAEGAHVIALPRFDVAIVKAYEEIERIPEVNLRFHVSLNRLHGDAPEGRRAIGDALARGLGWTDDRGNIHIGIPEDYVGKYFETLPLEEENWREAAKAMLHHLRG